MTMTSDRNGETESGRLVPAGSEVTYLAHVPLGMVKVRLPDGTEAIMHPHCFPTLR